MRAFRPSVGIGRSGCLMASKESRRFNATVPPSHGDSAASVQSPPSAARLARQAEAGLMQRMHGKMQADPHALRLHRELLLCLAKGDAEGSGDVAALLARRIGTSAAAEGSAPAPSASNPAELVAEESRSSDPIPYTDASLDDVTSKLSDLLQSSAGAGDGSAAGSTSSSIGSPLTVTIIDSNFELEAADSQHEDDARADEAAMRVLSQYLESDSGAWKAQKRAVAKAVLDAARLSGVTSEGLLQSDVAAGAGIAAQFSPFRECNVVVRCEVPAAGDDAAKAIDEQLAEMRKLPNWSADAESLARREMEMGAVSMRYKVGLHYSIEASLGDGACRAFVSAAMQALNEPTAEFSSALSIPTMPYTFMMRLCLWMEDPEATASSVVGGGVTTGQV